MRYRDRTEIVRQILEVANGGVNSKTKMMAKAYLSSYQLNEYLRMLFENELLRCDFVTRTFKTTQKGLEFLNLCTEIDELLIDEEEQDKDPIWVHNERQVSPLMQDTHTDCWQRLKL
jgi:predicted transcriptional regulator